MNLEEKFKEEFLNTKHPKEIEELSKKYAGMKIDIDMINHFNELAKQFSSGETRENHSDPREAFRKK